MRTSRRLEGLAIDVANWGHVLDVSDLRAERRRLLRRIARASARASSTTGQRSN
jgi:hypothetical protein